MSRFETLLESAPDAIGRGTTFSIYFPTVRSVEDAGHDSGDSSSAPVVLVVEDQAAVRRLVRTVLEEDRYRVLRAEDGGEALTQLDRHRGRVDLVLTDVVTPDVNGPELVARLTSLGHRARVLFVSGYADSTLLRRGLNDGSIQVLRKPFTREQLTARVAELVALDEERSPVSS